MPLTSLSLYPELPGAPALPIGDLLPLPADSRIHIRNIDGLGPVKADIQTAPFAIARGVFFQGSSTGQRNIVFTLGFNPLASDGGQTISDLRQQVYRYFMPEGKGRYVFHSSNLEDVHIDGVVEAVEPNIFSQDPEMQVSVLCPRPDFIGETANELGPFDCESGSHYITTEIDYTGSQSNGFELYVHDDSGIYNGAIEVTSVNGLFKSDIKVTGLTINSSQYFRLVTVATRRRVQYRDVSSDDLLASLMGKMWKGSSWPELFPGANQVGIYSDHVGPQWNMKYWNRYGGL